MQRKFKINGMPKDKEFNALPFGRQIEYFRKFEQFKASARSVWISQKRRTNTAAIAEARKLYSAGEFLAEFNDSPNYRDDSFQFWYVSRA